MTFSEIKSKIKSLIGQDSESDNPVLFAKFDFSEPFLRSLSNSSDFKVELHHPTWVAIGVFSISIFFGLFFTPLLWLGLSGFIVLAHQFTRIKTVAKHLSIHRTVKQVTVTTGQDIEINFEIWNRSTTQCPPLTLQDLTMYIRRSQSFASLSQSLGPNEKVDLTWSGTCEAPAGVVNLGCYRVELQDELGLFQVTLLGDDDIEFQVHQGQSLENERPLRSPKNSSLVGDLNVSSRGHGLILFGLREYRDGDPLSRIWWKKIVGDDGFLVKEFENDITRRVAVMISTESQFHLGYGASSTWEVAKTTALKMILGYLQSNSSVSLITAEHQIKDVAGSENFPLFQSTIEHLPLKPKSQNSWTLGGGASNSPASNVRSELELVGHYLSPPGLFYLITPYDAEIELRSMKELQLLKEDGFEPAVVFVNPTGSTDQVKRRFGEFQELITGGSPEAAEISQRFFAAGIPVYWVSAQDTNGQTEVFRYA